MVPEFVQGLRNIGLEAQSFHYGLNTFFSVRAMQVERVDAYVTRPTTDAALVAAPLKVM